MLTKVECVFKLSSMNSPLLMTVKLLLLLNIQVEDSNTDSLKQYHCSERATSLLITTSLHWTDSPLREAEIFTGQHILWI